MNTLKFEVYKNTLKRRDGFNPVLGEKNYTKIKCYFAESDWDKCTAVTANFMSDKDNIVKSTVSLTADDKTAVFDIPSELEGDKVYFSLTGSYAEDGGNTVTLNTNLVGINRQKGMLPSETVGFGLFEKILGFYNKISKLVEQLKNYVTPEMFGAKGDGVTDDTAALQQMFSQAGINNQAIKLGNSKTYLVSNTLRYDVSRSNFDGNFATIKVSDSCQKQDETYYGSEPKVTGLWSLNSVITVNIKSGNDAKYNIGSFNKLIIDCNNGLAKHGLKIENEGKTNYEKYESASVAMDIALGRGGDQAVIRQDGKYVFFGGKAQEVEKRTKVKARVISHALEELIKKSDNVMVMGHMNGDIDSIGSSLGIYRLAKTFEKEAYIVNNTYGLTLANFIVTLKQEGYKDVILDKTEAMNKITPNTLLVIVDTHKRSYVEVPELLEKTEKIVIIDHHRKSEDFIENAILTFHEAYASSASELVTEIVEYATQEVTLEQIEAESLYAGIMMDTKNFTFKTGVRTFEAAAYLRKYGIDIIKVKKWFQSDLESYTVIAEIVKNAEIINDSIGISVYEEKDKNANLICAKAADELLTISNISASFVLGRMGDKVCISGRSIGDINVQVILEKLGGGGHITLAGAQVEGMTLEEAKTELIIRINEYFAENNF